MPLRDSVQPSTASPATDDAALDRLLRALGDATRRRLLDRLRDQPGSTLSALGGGFALSRQAISKHLAVLAAADLVVTLWRGREKLHYLNPVPLQALPARWVTGDAQAHAAALQALQTGPAAWCRPDRRGTGRRASERAGATWGTAVSVPPNPTRVLSSVLAAAPGQVWASVCHSGFIGSYLGASLPAADLGSTPLPAAPLRGVLAGGALLTVQVTNRMPPSSLSLCLRSPAGDQLLHLSISACGAGSRLTLTHQPLPAADAADQAVPVAPEPRPDLARQLALPPPPQWLAGLPDDDAAVQAAAQYLAGTAQLVAWLRLEMAAGQGYWQPAGGGFSLVQHVWHLADVEQHGWSRRFTLLRRQAGAVLPGVDGDRLATEGRYQQRPWRAAATRFVTLRQRSLRALQACSLAVLRRPVLFSGQPATGTDVLAAMLAHDHEHRTEMAALWPPVD